MPNDTTNINTKAGNQYSYDAIVIGSGISGGWAAKELCEKGLKTILLERGEDIQHIKDYINKYIEFYYFNSLNFYVIKF